ncbi:hypothetical protein [Haladaptatus sp. DJG-WS-42]|uniref:hypothetical protein n=1 Tax=Haladaptatus sp. DJG-WS-42 TaxID=3120516 RepID=UPI0030D3AABF
MPNYAAIFEIDSKSDAEAVRLLVERVYDALREETQDIEDGKASLSQMLDEFRAIRDAARHAAPGTLSIQYEQSDEPFED